MSDILTCQNLTKRFEGKPALSDVTLHLERGRIIGLLGPNGSGKTTLLKLANGLLQPSVGSIEIDGKRPGVETKQLVSYLPDADYLPTWMQVGQLVELFSDFYTDFAADKARDMLHSLNLDERQRLKTLSKGNKEKVQLILAMSRQAQLYLLDEPIGGVDPAARDYILHTILTNYSENATVLISTHLIADVEQVLDEVIFLYNGQLALHRAVDEIRETEGKSVDALFREVYRC
jgi:ABC-2 type transport system ATP-binding protein